MATYEANSYNITARTNDDLVIPVEVGYSIMAYTPRFIIKRSELDLIDLSQYIVKTTSTSFTLSVKSSILSTIGEFAGFYDCAIDMGNGNKDFLFGGIISIKGGIA